MQFNILKDKSTKAERRVYEILKKNKIHFRYRWIINEREYDFLIGKIIIEIQNHPQNISKNKDIIEEGYSILHLTNNEIKENIEKVEQKIIKFIK